MDVAAYEVRRGGRRVPLTRQPMDCSSCCSSSAGTGHTRRHREAPVGPGRLHGPDAGIHTAILKIRQGLGDSRQRRDLSRPCLEGLSFCRGGRGRRASVSPGANSHSSTICQPSSPASLDVGRSSSNCQQCSLSAAAVTDGRRRSRKDASGDAARGRLVDEFPDGVWLVDLAPLSAPDLVARRSRPSGYSRGPTAIGPRGLARHSASSCAPARAGQLRASDRHLRRAR